MGVIFCTCERVDEDDKAVNTTCMCSAYACIWLKDLFDLVWPHQATLHKGISIIYMGTRSGDIYIGKTVCYKLVQHRINRVK